jgi:hypothetical protein
MPLLTSSIVKTPSTCNDTHQTARHVVAALTLHRPPAKWSPYNVVAEDCLASHVLITCITELLTAACQTQLQAASLHAADYVFESNVRRLKTVMSCAETLAAIQCNSAAGQPA